MKSIAGVEHMSPLKKWISLFHVHRGVLKSPHADQRESWWELFYDLLLVAVCIRLGEVVITDLTLFGVLQSFMLYLNYYSLWCLCAFYFTLLETDTLFYIVAYTMHYLATFWSLIYLDINGSKGQWDVQRSGQGFAVSCLFARVAFLPFYYEHWWARGYKAKALLKDPFYLFTGCLTLSCVLWAVSLAFWDDQRVEWVWGIACFLETSSLYHHVTHRSEHSHVNIEYFFDRLNALILIVFGESIIQLVTFGEEDTPYTFYYSFHLCLSLSLVIFLAVLYFTTRNKVCEAFMESYVHSNLWLACIMPLSFAIMVYGHAIEAISKTLTVVRENLEHFEEAKEQANEEAEEEIKASEEEFEEVLEALEGAGEVKTTEEKTEGQSVSNNEGEEGGRMLLEIDLSEEVDAALRHYLRVFNECREHEDNAWEFTECTCALPEKAVHMLQLHKTCRLQDSFYQFFDMERIALFFTSLVIISAVITYKFSFVRCTCKMPSFFMLCTTYVLYIAFFSATYQNDDIHSEDSRQSALALRLIYQLVTLLVLKIVCLYALHDEKPGPSVGVESANNIMDNSGTPEEPVEFKVAGA